MSSFSITFLAIGKPRKQPIILLPEKDTRCNSKRAKFGFTSEGKILHLQTELCAYLNVSKEKKHEGLFELTDCENGTRLHYGAGEKDFDGKSRII